MRIQTGAIRSWPEAVGATLLVVSWSFVLATHLYQSVTDGLTWPPFGVTAPAGPAEYPTVRDFLPRGQQHAGDLQVGDVVVAVGESDLRGSSPLALAATTVSQGRQGGYLTVTYRRPDSDELRRTEIFLPPPPYPWWRVIPVAIGFIIPNAIVLWRAPSSAMRRNLFLGSVFYVLLWARFLGGDTYVTYAGFAIFAFAAAVAWPMIIRGALLFPEETATDSRWKRTWPWVFAVGAPLGTSAVYGIPFSYAFTMKAVCGFGAVFCFSVLAIIAHNYRRSEPIARRRIKWVLFTFYLGILPELIAAAMAAVSTDYFWLAESTVAVTAIAPLGIFIAIVRYNLFDIDRVISATATYSILTFLTAATIVYVVPQLTTYMSAFTGTDPAHGQLIISIVFACLWLMSHRYVRPIVNRVFFAEQYALERTVSDLLAAIRSAVDEHELYRVSGVGLSEISQSANVAIYSKDSEGYLRKYPDTGDSPSQIKPDEPIYGIIERMRSTIIEESTGWKAGSAGGPLERAALQMLGLAIIIPNTVGGAILGFMGVARKTSRDIFTHTDVTRFEMVGGQFAYELMRLRNAHEQEQVLDRQKRIARYLPEVVSKRILAGETVESGEYELTVLFVDIRSYTTYAENRRPDEVFSLINQYATSVYNIVKANNGAVVQFQGDGVMAIFGGPMGQKDKEANALRAAMEIVSELSPQVTGPTDGAIAKIRVGVGVASGPSHLGTFGGPESAVWSAVGHSVNLASRLQELAKQYDAVVVTEAATWANAKGAGLGFERIENVRIRGMSQMYDLYALRL